MIVDDEPIARDLLLHYCSHLPYLRVVAVCGNAFEAREALQSSPVDILFLDIKMPVMDGFQFLSTLRNPPQVIFTTAFKEYGAVAFDHYACDYLVKPFSLERFMIAIDKAIERLTKDESQELSSSGATGNDESIFIKTDGKYYKVDFNELLYAEANGNTTKVVTVSDTLATTMTFSAMQQILPSPSFIKVHRSFIINRSKITFIEGNRVFIGKTQIAIGANYRESFLNALKI